MVIFFIVIIFPDTFRVCRLLQPQPPVLNPQLSKVDGLAFLGLSLSRRSEEGHPDSITHQTAFDLNEVIDRKYEYLASTNDDGWLVGGGEPGPPKSYKLPAKDSAHVEIMRIGTYNPAVSVLIHFISLRILMHVFSRVIFSIVGWYRGEGDCGCNAQW